ncbi:unnamed protein product, partial [Discosporangium mesarthrocarpum]
GEAGWNGQQRPLGTPGGVGGEREKDDGRGGSKGSQQVGAAGRQLGAKGWQCGPMGAATMGSTAPERHLELAKTAPLGHCALRLGDSPLSPVGPPGSTTTGVGLAPGSLVGEMDSSDNVRRGNPNLDPGADPEPGSELEPEPGPELGPEINTPGSRGVGGEGSHGDSRHSRG